MLVKAISIIFFCGNREVSHRPKPNRKKKNPHPATANSKTKTTKYKSKRKLYLPTDDDGGSGAQILLLMIIATRMTTTKKNVDKRNDGATANEPYEWMIKKKLCHSVRALVLMNRRKHEKKTKRKGKKENNKKPHINISNKWECRKEETAAAVRCRSAVENYCWITIQIYFAECCCCCCCFCLRAVRMRMCEVVTRNTMHVNGLNHIQL